MGLPVLYPKGIAPASRATCERYTYTPQGRVLEDEREPGICSRLNQLNTPSGPSFFFPPPRRVRTVGTRMLWLWERVSRTRRCQHCARAAASASSYRRTPRSKACFALCWPGVCMDRQDETPSRSKRFRKQARKSSEKSSGYGSGAAPVVPDPSGRPAGRPAERVVRGGQTGAAPVEAELSDAQSADEPAIDLDARFNVGAADDLGGDDDAQDHRAAARREARLAARRIAEAAMRGARHRP